MQSLMFNADIKPLTSLLEKKKKEKSWREIISPRVSRGNCRAPDAVTARSTVGRPRPLAELH